MENFSKHKTDPTSRLKYCSLHTSMITTEYCNTCQQYICYSCYDHDGHERIRYDDQVKNLREDLQRFRNQCIVELKYGESELKEMFADKRAEKASLRNRCNEIEKELKKLKEARREFNNRTDSMTYLQRSLSIIQNNKNQVEKLLALDDSVVVQEGPALLEGSHNPDAATPLSVPTGELSQMSDNLDPIRFNLTDSSAQAPITHQLESISQPDYETPTLHPGPSHIKYSKHQRHLVFDSDSDLEGEGSHVRRPWKKHKTD